MSEVVTEFTPPEGEDAVRRRGSAVADAWDQYVRSLSQSAHSEFSSIPAQVIDRVAEPLAECLRQMGEAHAALVGKLTVGGEAAGVVGQLELATLRKSAAAEIGGHLLKVIRDIDAPAVVAQMFLDRLGRLREIAQQAPEEIVLPDESEAYLPSAEDVLGTRLHKLWLRGVRRLRSWLDSGSNLVLKIARRPTRPITPPDRLVPLRQLLRFHVDRRIGSVALRTQDLLQRSVAQIHASLERDATDWAFGLLEADDEFGLEDRVQLRDEHHASGAKEGNQQGSVASGTVEIESVVVVVKRLAGEEIDLQLDALTRESDELLGDSDRRLLADLVSAGTPLLESADRSLPDGPGPILEKLSAVGHRWARWHEQFVNRLTLNHCVLVLRESLADRAETILRDIRNAALEPVLAAFDEAERLIDAAPPNLDRAFAAGREAHQVADMLLTIQQNAVQQFGRIFRSTVARDAQSSLTQPGLDHWKELTVSVMQLPGDLMVHARSRDAHAEVDPGKRPFAINLREITTNALSPAWPALLSEATGPLKAAITRAWVGAEKLQHVIDYNLGAAVEELLGEDKVAHDAAVPMTGTEVQPPPPRETAFGLAADAVRRTGELVEELRGSLAEPWSAFTRTFDAAVHDDWRDLIDQVKSDDLMMERWVGMRTRALRQAERTHDRIELLWKRGMSAARQRAAVTRRFSARLLRRGRSAVGVVDAAEEVETTITEALWSAENARKALPLVYRRLFGFGVVADESLLEGRGRDLVNVRKRFERWRSGGGPGILILTAPIGSGRTSFLEALRSKVLDECTVKTLALRERVSDVDWLIAALCEMLGTPNRARGLQQLETALTSRTKGSAPLVIVIDNLEHLMLQSADGTDVLRQLLGVMLRTDHAVFWLAAVSQEAWRYVCVAASADVASVGTYSLAPLDRRDVEDVILGRHHRSGMTLQFVAPQDRSPILRRRLRRAATGERQQEILKELFFDGLCRHSGNDLSLTMLYWLRSVQFAEDGDAVSVRPVQPISFAQLRQLDLAQLFALRAFVVHNTLTAAELGSVLRVAVDRAVLLLESLINLALIERVHADGATVDHPIDAAADRFRLSRIVIYPVLERLRGAHVIY